MSGLLQTTRIILSSKRYGAAALRLLDDCAAEAPQFYAELLRRHPPDRDGLAAEKIALAISSQGRRQRGHPGWAWYEAWSHAHDEAGFAEDIIQDLAGRLALQPAVAVLLRRALPHSAR